MQQMKGHNGWEGRGWQLSFHLSTEPPHHLKNEGLAMASPHPCTSSITVGCSCAAGRGRGAECPPGDTASDLATKG